MSEEVKLYPIMFASAIWKSIWFSKRSESAPGARDWRVMEASDDGTYPAIHGFDLLFFI